MNISFNPVYKPACRLAGLQTAIIVILSYEVILENFFEVHGVDLGGRISPPFKVHYNSRATYK